MTTPAQYPQLDVIAVGAHPDDVEIACGGTLAKLAKQGYSVGIIDLTDGEPTPMSAGPEVRLAEAKQAAQMLGAAVRVTLELPGHGQVALAVEPEGHERVDAGLGAEGRAQVAPVDRDGDRVHAVPVEHGRDLPVTPQPVGRARPRRPSGLSSESDFFHERESLGEPAQA